MNSVATFLTTVKIKRYFSITRYGVLFCRRCTDNSPVRILVSEPFLIGIIILEYGLISILREVKNDFDADPFYLNRNAAKLQ